MLDLLLNPMVLKALLAILIAGIVSSTISVYVVLKGLSALGAAIAHAALAGATIALIAGIDPTLGALMVSLAFAFLSGYGEEKTGGRSDMVVGILFGFSTAIAVLAIALASPYVSSAWRFLVGDALGVTDYELVELLTIATIVAVSITTSYGELKCLLFDPEASEASGLNIRLYKYLILILTSLCTVINLKVVGAILAELFVAAPAIIAYEFAHSLEEMRNNALIATIICSLLGFFSALALNLPVSGVVGVTLAGAYLLSVFTSTKRRKCFPKTCLRHVKEFFRG